MGTAETDAADGLTVEFTPTADDYAAFWDHLDRTSPVVRRRYRLTTALVVVFSIAMAVLIATGPRRAVGFGTSLLLGYIGLYLVWILFLRRPLVRRSARRRMRDGTFLSYLAPTRLTASPAGIAVSNALSQSAYAWSAVTDLTVTAGAIYVFVNSMAAIIIPVRAFPDQATFAAFADGLRRQRQAASGG